MRLFQLTAFCVAALLIIFASSKSQAGRLDFYLTINVVTDTWELAASTDSPGGIASIVCNLVNYGVGHSVAPRSAYGDTPIKGFTIGYFELPNPDPRVIPGSTLSG